jgi:hypothetical protein
LPADAPVPEAKAFVNVDARRAQVLAAKSADALRDVSWNTQQWLRFFDGLTADSQLLAAIDAQRHFTQTGNSEIACVWLEHAIRANYQPAMPQLEQFLTTVGRRKFLVPLYTELVRTPEGQARAAAIYRRARPGYHAVSVRTLDALLKWTDR